MRLHKVLRVSWRRKTEKNRKINVLHCEELSPCEGRGVAGVFPFAQMEKAKPGKVTSSTCSSFQFERNVAIDWSLENRDSSFEYMADN
ncbi:Os03g0164100 [Oryza sativa Japonica Group]|jgi:hypothetical protein|uniref:Os03g0164100 protein n=2 Tax=Oryza sativa subsp. japonica TaxID=39947 RepID=A0A0N7KGM7_ORYSJ|nr:hypothetical protein OsJ_09527 [Oryza sativa Japonica Group]KAB8090338.1 hypothetical protein EE612_015494 [Oryza sativa]KAB8090339.1 hypothetical protein EE612_015494 [Oryza sativa]BAF10974.1 Os03g0164100 [Oryza sativa Japonica Group]BAS82449.1 Os03g0164100 [Oryza sativa Japonica Group]|eukprot:NP_001049060.1 Os03g0164100 [Oryza sativa Japonica Group]